MNGLNTIDKHYIYQLISNVQLHVSNIFDYQTQIHTSTQDKDVSLSKESQQYLTKENLEKIMSLIKANTEKYSVKENGQTERIMFKIIMTLHTNT